MGCRVQGAGNRELGAGYRVQSVGCRVLDLPAQPQHGLQPALEVVGSAWGCEQLLFRRRGTLASHEVSLETTPTGTPCDTHIELDRVDNAVAVPPQGLYTVSSPATIRTKTFAQGEFAISKRHPSRIDPIKKVRNAI